MLTEHKAKGSVFGATLLISGCCIGAGMLGMPVVTREAGFLPSLFIFLVSWVFMTLSGLITLEIALWFPNETNLAEMARKYLGRSGEGIVFFLMMFLMYALMTAYSAGSGRLIEDFTQGAISASLGKVLFVAALVGVLTVGTRALDWFNRLFMVGLVASYAALVALGLPEVDAGNLTQSNWSAAFVALPITLVAFGFQNLVPSLVRYLDRDVKKIRLSILLGSLIPLVIYLVWEWLVLGLVSQGIEGLDEAEMATSLIRKAAGGLDWVITLAELFAFFAIATSFMGNALSVLDFISDQIGGSPFFGRRAALALLTCLPPLIFAYIHPHIFLEALGVAGSFSATLLFGLVPALICLKGRRTEKATAWRFWGGTPLLLVLVAFSLAILALS